MYEVICKLVSLYSQMIVRGFTRINPTNVKSVRVHAPISTMQSEMETR